MRAPPDAYPMEGIARRIAAGAGSAVHEDAARALLRPCRMLTARA